MPAEVRVRRRRGSPFGGRAALARGSREGRFGKSTVSGTLARALARRARDVVALDSDTMPGMRRSLGTREAEVTRLMEAVERGEDGKWRLRKGFGPVRTVQRCTTAAPDGVRVLQLGKADAEDNLESIHGAVMAFHKIACELAGSPTARRWTIVGDLPAGPRHLAAGFAAYAARRRGGRRADEPVRPGRPPLRLVRARAHGRAGVLRRQLGAGLIAYAVTAYQRGNPPTRPRPRKRTGPPSRSRQRIGQS